MTILIKTQQWVFVCIFLFCFQSFARLNCKYYLNSKYQPIPQIMKKANESYKNGKYQQAIEYLESILAIDRQDIFATSLLARNYYLVKNFNMALRLQLQVLQLEKRYNEVSYFSMAQFFLALGKKDYALKYFNEVIKNNPNHLAALGLTARIFLEKNELELAYDLIHRKLEVDPKDTHALSLFVEYFYKKGQLNQALKFAQRLVNENAPRKKQVRVPKAYRTGLALRAKVLVALGGKTNLEIALNDIKTLEPMMANVSGWVGLLKAEAFYKLGDVKQSLSVLLHGVRSSQVLDIAILAAMVKIEIGGEGLKTNFNPVLEVAFKQLNPTEVFEVLRLSKQDSWDFVPDANIKFSPGIIINSFWSGLHNMPVDGQTFRSTY